MGPRGGTGQRSVGGDEGPTQRGQVGPHAMMSSSNSLSVGIAVQPRTLTFGFDSPSPSY